jgi:acetyltransferase-like isoleucine patch superfamily enzyme
MILSTPWKITNALSCIFSYPIVRMLFAVNQIKWEMNWRFYGIPIIQKHRHSLMSFGSGLQLRSAVSSNPLGANHPVILCTWLMNAEIMIGKNFGMTGGNICAAQSVTIGNNVSIGANSSILDTDFHPIDALERRINPQKANTAPVHIEDDVFIGMNCLILKGVTIGQASVIGAGSVVTKSIPPNAIVAGNPAKIIKTGLSPNMTV